MNDHLAMNLFATVNRDLFDSEGNLVMAQHTASLYRDTNPEAGTVRWTLIDRLGSDNERLFETQTPDEGGWIIQARSDLEGAVKFTYGPAEILLLDGETW